AWIPGERTARVPDVARDVVQRGAVAVRANAFFDLLHAAEVDDRLAARVGGRGAVANLVGYREIDERLKLGVQVLFGRVTTTRPPHDRRETMEECHAPS